MAVKLEKKALRYTKKLIQQRKFVADERDAWSEHQPSTLEENGFIRQEIVVIKAVTPSGAEVDKGQAIQSQPNR